MKKKNIILASCIILSLSMLAACGQKNTQEDNNSTAMSEDTDKKETKSMEAESSTEAALEGSELSTKMWMLTYPEGWSYKEDNFSDEEGYGSVVLISKDEETEIEIEVENERKEEYRDYLAEIGVDAYEMVENNVGDFVEIDGVKCIKNPKEDKLYYLGRIEKAGSTVKIKVTGKYDNPEVEKIIGTVKFAVKDTGNVEPPWPWKGTPLAPEASYTKMLADYTVTSQWIPFEESVIVRDIFSGEFAASEDKLWLLSDDILREYSLGEKLVKEWENDALEEHYEKISRDKNDNIYLTGFMAPMLTILNRETVSSNEDVDKAVMSPSGEWGVSFFYGSANKKVTLNDNIASLSEWLPMENVNVSSVSISENHIFVAGSDKETNNHGIWVFDTAGNQQLVLGNKAFGEPDNLGSVTQVAETANGFIGFDGNLRNLVFWKTDGTYIGNIKGSEVFGVSYPWISAAAVQSDGSVLVGMTQEREDESADEFIVFRLTGF